MFQDVGAGGHAPLEHFEILHSRKSILSHPGPILNGYYLDTVKNEQKERRLA